MPRLETRTERNPCSPEQVQRDCETLRQIVAGLERLEGVWSNAQTLIHARSRGYFTPDEDDAVRQILLSYRNYRLGLYNIILRCIQYPVIEEPRLQLQVFMTGFAAGLVLYGKSLKLIQTYERQPLVRKKLNEPEEKFGLEEGFFEEVLEAYSSPRNYRLLLQGVFFWRKHRRKAKELGLLETEEGKWLAGIIRQQRKVIRKRLLQVLLARLRYDFRLFWETTLRPVRRTGYALKSAVGTTFATARISFDYHPAITSEVMEALRSQLRPGDVLLVRADEKLTAAILPGFWAHAAIYLGNKEGLEGAGLAAFPGVAKHLSKLPEGNSSLVLEAIAPRCLVNSLENSLYADHVVVLRPNLPVALLASALEEAFAHLGKPYDFEFDFNVTNRIVCTEVVYRAFHKKGAILFTLIKRLGRFTLSGNDIVHQALDVLRDVPMEQAPFRPVILFTKTPSGFRFVEEAEIVPTLQAIREGKPLPVHSITPPPRQYSPA